MKVHKYSFILVGLIQQSLAAMEQPQMPPAQVSVVEAQQRLLSPTSKISGSVISINNSEIASQVAGELIWLAQVGESVTKGELIAELDSTRYSAAVQFSEAQLERFQADLKFREQEVTRLKELATRNNTSKARLQEETARRNMLKQDVKSAKANLSLAQYDLSLTKIRAPFAGHITHRLSSKGEYLTMGNKLLRLVDTYNREISLNAPIEALQYLENGDFVQVNSKRKSDRLAVKAIVPVGDAISRMIEIRLSTQDNSWIIGSPVSVLIPNAEEKNRITIPRDALIIKGSDVFIYRINSDMKAERINANIDAVDGLWVAIKAELKADDKIVIRGGERLSSGQTVSFLEMK